MVSMICSRSHRASLGPSSVEHTFLHRLSGPGPPGHWDTTGFSRLKRPCKVTPVRGPLGSPGDGLPGGWERFLLRKGFLQFAPSSAAWPRLGWGLRAVGKAGSTGRISGLSLHRRTRHRRGEGNPRPPPSPLSRCRRSGSQAPFSYLLSLGVSAKIWRMECTRGNSEPLRLSMRQCQAAFGQRPTPEHSEPGLRSRRGGGRRAGRGARAPAQPAPATPGFLWDSQPAAAIYPSV